MNHEKRDSCVYCGQIFSNGSYPKVEYSTLLGINEIQDHKFCTFECYDEYDKAKLIIYKIVYDAILEYQNNIKRISGDSNEI